MTILAPLTQIAYIPTHAKGSITRPDTEFGFVMAEHPASLNFYCYFWMKEYPGELPPNAEPRLIPLSLLVEHQSVPKFIVDAVVARLPKTQESEEPETQPKHHPTIPGYYTGDQVAQMLGVSGARVRKLAQVYKWEFTKISNAKVYKAGDVDSYAEARQRFKTLKQQGKIKGQERPIWQDPEN